MKDELKFAASIVGLLMVVLAIGIAIKRSEEKMSATHSYPWRDEHMAEVVAKTEIAGQVVAALASKQQSQPLDEKERATYNAALDYVLKVMQ